MGETYVGYKNMDPKTLLGQKVIRSKNILCPKPYWAKKIYKSKNKSIYLRAKKCRDKCQKKLLVKILFLVQIKFWPKRNVLFYHNFGSKHYVVKNIFFQKYFRSKLKNNVPSKTIWDKEYSKKRKNLSILTRIKFWLNSKMGQLYLCFDFIKFDTEYQSLFCLLFEISKFIFRSIRWTQHHVCLEQWTI